MKPSTLGELKEVSGVPSRFRSVRDEIRENLICSLQSHDELFPGIVGYDDSVVPALVNALLARHNFILLGLRGQAKSRILRDLTRFLDAEIPVIAGSEINDDPFFPISDVSRRRIQEEGDDLPISYLKRHQRYVEKLATPDVTVADIIGDLDPIKAARHGSQLSSFENVHFGLLPRANRGIFAINELPDLAPKIQVALFNIMQEGDVQIKGFPVRLPLDVLLVFSANPEDYTARGKIITPLKDRIGDEIRTHYPNEVNLGVQITRQEAWTERESPVQILVPEFFGELVEQVAFTGRDDKRIDKRSGVSQRLPITCMETCISNAENRALRNDDAAAVVRVSDLYAAIPAITGKLELEYEGELKGAERIATDLIQSAIARIFEKYFPNQNFEQLTQWFDLGGEVKASDATGDSEYYEKLSQIQGIEALLKGLNIKPGKETGMAVSTMEFILEGLCVQKRLSRNEEKGYYKSPKDVDADFFKEVERGRTSFN